MKKQFKFFSFVFVSFLLFSCTSVKPIENFEVLDEKTYEFEVDNATIKIARLWVAETYNSAKDVIQICDEELNVLIGDGLYTTIGQYVFTTSETNFKYRFKIQCKNNKVTITYYNFDFGPLSSFLIPTGDELSYRSYGANQQTVLNFYKQLDMLGLSLEFYYKTF